VLLPLLVALAAFAPGAAVAQVAPPLLEKRVASNALQLAHLLGPDAETAALAVRGFEEALSRDFAADPEHAEFESRHPGFTTAIVSAARTAFADHYRAVMPARHRRYARFFETRFTSDEIDTLVQFYSGPTGRKAIAEMFRAADASMKRGAGVEETRGDVERASPPFNARDKATLARMAKTSAFAKLATAMPAYAQLTLAIRTEPDPTLEPMLRKAVMAATEAFGEAERKAAAR
jgi:hypothetical protein